MVSQKINIFYLFSLISTLALIAYISFISIPRLNMVVGATEVKTMVILILALLIVSVIIQVFLIFSSRREK